MFPFVSVLILFWIFLKDYCFHLLCSSLFESTFRYADTSGAGKDVYEFVSRNNTSAFDVFCVCLWFNCEHLDTG